jgi:hypothetical protein
MWALLPLCLDLGRARCIAWSVEVTRGKQRKLLLTAAGAALVVLLVLTAHPVWALLLAPLVLGPAIARASGMARRRLQMRRIARSEHPLDGLPPAGQTLRQMGLDEATAERIAGAAGAAEVRIATFDQESRVLSEVGPIPFFEGLQITPQQFRGRNRHVIELVIARGVLCVKKSYRDRRSLEIELLALHAMAGLPAVPRIVAVDLQRRILHQSFVRGQNLGVLMSRHGVNDHVQDQVSVAYWGPDRWGRESLAGVRARAVAALAAMVAPGVVDRIGRLIEEIHHPGRNHHRRQIRQRPPGGWRGISATSTARPSGVGTAGASRGSGNTIGRCSITSSTAGCSLTVNSGSRWHRSRERSDLLSPRLYYGQGYQSSAAGSLALGSGRWRCLRPSLPDVMGLSILALGAGNGVVPLEMLRAGARRVTAWEQDPILARYARLNHRWFEFTDNPGTPASRFWRAGPKRLPRGTGPDTTW